jgi:uncharacterized lipoprotein
MKKKSLLLILGGTLTTLLGLGLSRKKRVERPTERILDQLNETYGPRSPAYNKDVPDVTYPIPDMPTKLAGGKINLIRAVNDDAHNRIKEISARIKEIDAERAQLVIELEAHNEMWEVAKKYMERLTVKVTK